MTIDRSTGRIISVEPVPEGVDLNEYMQQVIHDCPECRAARERGEEPIIFTPSAARPDRETRQTRRARRRRERKARKRSR